MDVVAATANNAVDGLYLTPDMCFYATNNAGDDLESAVDKFHARQPRNADYETLADAVNESYFNRKAHERKEDQHAFVRFCDLSMMAADLCNTAANIRRGLMAAVNAALALHLRDIGVADDAPYRRVIPPALENVHIAKIPEIGIDTFLRILAVDPWQSWLERLRAQKQRTTKLLAISEAGELLVQGATRLLDFFDDIEAAPQYQRTHYETHHKARKSIRKSIKLFDRLGRAEDLRRFLESASLRAGESFGPLLIEGKNYNYALVMQPGSLLRLTINCNNKTSPFGITVLNKQNERLCEICVYFKDTPLLDSVMAVALNAQNEETELEMLDAACVMGTPGRFYADPVLPDLKGLHDPVTTPTLVNGVFNYANSLPSEHHALQAALIKQSLPMAYGAFVRIMRPGKRYLSTMRGCADYDPWAMMSGHENAFANLLLVQQTLQRGEY